MPDKKNDDEQSEKRLDTNEQADLDIGSPEVQDDLADTESEAKTETEKSVEFVPDLVIDDGRDHTEETALGEVPDPSNESPESVDEPTPFDDAKTDQAINEIVAKESDDILAAQDAAAGIGGIKAKTKGHFFRNFWYNKWARSLLLLIVLGGIVAVMVIPKTRYWIFNTAGVRSSSSIIVVDSASQLPLKGVQVSLGGHKGETNAEGKASFTGLELGPVALTVKQVGFGEIKRTVTIGWGSNPLGGLALKATGVQYTIEVRDYLSDKPVAGVEATDGQATAVSGPDGKITLTLENAIVIKDGISLSKAGYRTEVTTLEGDVNKSTKVALVLARKAVFVTKQSGKYDVYKSDIDGKNRTVLLAGTGAENSNISLAVSSDGARAAFVSTRSDKRDSSGFLLSTLTLINTDNGNTVAIAESPQIQLIDWIGSRLVFQLASSDADSDERYTVTSYNYTDNTRLQLAKANNLSAVISAKGSIYYAIRPYEADPALKVGLFKIGADGKGGQQLFDEELSTVLRATYTTLNLQSAEGTWYTYDLNAGSKSQISTPASLANRMYTDNDARSKSLWAGQGTLKLHDVATSKDTDVVTKSGLTNPLHWISGSAVIFRVSSGTETADYAVSTEGGTAHKIADVTATYGFSQAQ